MNSTWNVQHYWDLPGFCPFWNLPAEFQVWHRLRFWSRGVAIVIRGSLIVFRGHTSEVPSYEILFIKLDLGEWSHSGFGVPVRAVTMWSKIGGVFSVPFDMVKSHPNFYGILYCHHSLQGDWTYWIGLPLGTDGPRMISEWANGYFYWNNRITAAQSIRSVGFRLK